MPQDEKMLIQRIREADQKDDQKTKDALIKELGREPTFGELYPEIRNLFYGD